jgi:hypothetical protein
VPGGRRYFSFLSFLIASTIAWSNAYGGAYLEPEGQGQLIVTTTFSNASKAYDSRGRLIRTPSYRKFETRNYVEYGALDWLTLIGESNYMNFRGASSPLDHLSLLIDEAKAGAPLSLKGADGPRYTGLGVGALGARVCLYQSENYVVSVEASLRAATPTARVFLDMRDELQGDARLQVGRTFEVFGLPGFYDAQIGYRWRGQSGDELRADVTTGLRPFGRLLLLAQSFTAATLGKPRAEYMYSQKFQLSAVYEVMQNVSVQIGALAALQGVNSSAERGVVSALWYRF